MTVILISWENISGVVQTKEGVEYWVSRIIGRGGVPRVQYLTDGAK